MEEIINKITFLEDKMDLITQNYQFVIGTFIGVLGIAIAIAGGALVVLAKSWFDKKVEKELREVNEEISKLRNALIETNNDVIKYKKENLILSEQINKIVIGGGSKTSGYTHLKDGTHICYLKHKVSIRQSSEETYYFPCSFEDDEVIPSINVINNKNILATIEKVTSGSITISFENITGLKTTEEFEVSVIVLGRFTNKIK
ncbi:MAG: hypothetical protein E6585_23995 [Serratia marcescens]|nr:hypothetical protein [Serratia marcescens]